MSHDNKKHLPKNEAHQQVQPGSRQELPPNSGIGFLEQQIQPKRITGLPPAVQAKMEGHFGQDLSHLQVKTNSQEATQLQAKAFARGSEVHFAPGQYQPHTQEGQKLIGHEVAHTVQQQRGEVSPTAEVEGKALNNSPALEARAEQEGAKAANYRPTPIQDFSLQRGQLSAPGMRVGGRMVEHTPLQRGVTGSPTYQLYRGTDFLQAQVKSGSGTTVTQMALSDWLSINSTVGLLLLLEGGLTVWNGVIQLNAAKEDETDDSTRKFYTAIATIGIGSSKILRGFGAFLKNVTDNAAADSAWKKVGDAITHISNGLRLAEGLASLGTGAWSKKWANILFGVLKTIRSGIRAITPLVKAYPKLKYVADALHYLEVAFTAIIAYQTPNETSKAITYTVAGSKAGRATLDTVKDYQSNNSGENEAEPDLEAPKANIHSPLLPGNQETQV